MDKVKELISRVIEHDILALGSQLSYGLILAFFPFLIFLMTIVGFSSIKSSDVLAQLQNIMPNEVIGLIKKTITDVVDKKNLNLLSFGFITTLWASSSGFKAVIKALNKAYMEKESRSFLKIQLTSLLLTIWLTVIIISSAVLLVFGEINGELLAGWLGASEAFRTLWNILRYVSMLAVMVLIFSALYHYTPSRKMTWKETFPGALFTTAGWVICSQGFSIYINNFGSYSKIYGSIGAIIMFLFWLFLISVVLLIGGEINAMQSHTKR